MREFKKIPQTLQLFPGTLCGLLFRADFKYIETGLLIFHWKCFGAKEYKFLVKSADKRTIQTFVEILYMFCLWS